MENLNYLENLVNRIEEVVAERKRKLRKGEVDYLQYRLLEIAEKLDKIETENVEDSYIITNSKHTENVKELLIQYKYQKRAIVSAIKYLQFVLRSMKVE